MTSSQPEVVSSSAEMATRPGSGQCLLDCPEDGEPLATRRESERRETEHTMDSLNLGERERNTPISIVRKIPAQSAYRADLAGNENLQRQLAALVVIQEGRDGVWIF